MPVRVKICGLKTPEALDVALEAGADMVGFVFFPPSPRNVGYRGGSRRSARGCAGGRRRSRCRSMPPMSSSRRSIEALKPDLLQLHGKETPERVAMVRIALRAAGDEGAADRRARRPLAGPAL